MNAKLYYINSIKKQMNINQKHLVKTSAKNIKQKIRH